MGRWARIAVATVGLLGLLPACGRRPSLAPVGMVKARSSELAPALTEAGIGGAITVAACRDALAAAGFPIDERARRSYQATVEVVAFSVTVPRPGVRPSAEVVVELELEQSWAEGPARRQPGRGLAPLEDGAASQAAWREALKGAVTDAARSLALDLLASQKPAEALVVDLSAADARTRERAVRALAARGERSAARAVGGRVRDPDPAVARAAVDALAGFKDPASALALIEAAQAGDATTAVRLIPVLAEIGGPDVEGYLLTLRSGHADRAVREAAAQALARLRRAPGAVGAKR